MFSSYYGYGHHSYYLDIFFFEIYPTHWQVETPRVAWYYPGHECKVAQANEVQQCVLRSVFDKITTKSTTTFG